MSVMQELTAARKEAGLSQERLGERLGMSRSAVSHWEADGPGQRDIGLAEAERYAAAVGRRLTVQAADLEPDFAACLEGMLKALEFMDDSEQFWRLHARVLRQLAAQAWVRVNPPTAAQQFDDAMDASSLRTPEVTAAAEEERRKLEGSLTGMALEQYDWER